MPYMEIGNTRSIQYQIWYNNRVPNHLPLHKLSESRVYQPCNLLYIADKPAHLIKCVVYWYFVRSREINALGL